MRIKKMYILISIIIFISCTNSHYIPNGKYCMSYSFGLNKELFGGAPDNTLIVYNNRFTYIEFEPYIPVEKGRITEKYLLFDNGDSLIYYFDSKELITYNPKDSIISEYYKFAWYKCDS